jgi:hypothetical protein
VNAATRPHFGKGVKLRRESDGRTMLLVPEGALLLNAPAALALTLVDGNRTLRQIVDAVVDRFDVTPERAHDDLSQLFDRLAERGFMKPFDACVGDAP